MCKLYSTYSAATAALLYLATRCFERVILVKPRSSRATGPERYLACFGFKPELSATQMTLAALSFSHQRGAGHSPLTLPLLSAVVPLQHLERDQWFLESLRSATSMLAACQTQALQAVVDRALYLEAMATQTTMSLGLSTERPWRPALQVDTSSTCCTAELVSPTRPSHRTVRGGSPRRGHGRPHRGHARRERTRQALGKAAGKGGPSSPQKTHRHRA